MRSLAERSCDIFEVWTMDGRWTFRLGEPLGATLQKFPQTLSFEKNFYYILNCLWASLLAPWTFHLCFGRDMLTSISPKRPPVYASVEATTEIWKITMHAVLWAFRLVCCLLFCVDCDTNEPIVLIDLWGQITELQYSVRQVQLPDLGGKSGDQRFCCELIKKWLGLTKQ